MSDTKRLLAEHRFFLHLRPDHLDTIASCASLKTYAAQDMLGKEGSASEYFFALIDGRVAIETYLPGSKPVILQTLHGGDIVGWSWLFPPYEWVFDARAVTRVRAIAMDARSLREECDKNPALGYELMKRFSQVMTTRLKATRLQLLDLYGRTQPSGSDGQND